MKKILPIELTAVFMELEDKTVFGFFSQIPETAIGGDSVEEVERKLFNVLNDVLEIKDEIAEEDYPSYNAKKIHKKVYTFQPVIPKHVYETRGSKGGSIIKRLLHLQTEAKRRWKALFPRKAWS